MQEHRLLLAGFLLISVVPMTAAQTDGAGKVFIIGLDGASHDLMQQCIEDGDMPNMEALLDEGGMVPMQAPLPPLTPVVMSSFLTGKDPGGHGVYGFEQRSPLTYDTTTVDSTDLDRILPEAIEGQSVLINVPMTYPAPRINGVVVSGFPGSSSGRYTHPPQLRQELEAMNYTVTTAGSYSDQTELEDEVFTALDQRTNISLEYMERYDWSLFMTMFTGDARLQHFRAYESCEGALKRYYEEVDAFLGEAQERLPEDATVIVMSNHGFKELRTKAYMYSLLKEGGFLEPELVPYIKHFGQELAGSVLGRLGIGGSAGELSGTSFSSAYMDEIDWDRTRAYTGSFYNGQVFLNVKGEEPDGTVPPEEYEETRAEIRSYLEGVENPATGEPLFEEVHTRDELYSGEHLEDMPDIVVEAPGVNHIARFGFWKDMLQDPAEQSTPFRTGFVAGSRPFTVDEAGITDLSTTVAALLNASYGEGKVITSMNTNTGTGP